MIYSGYKTSADYAYRWPGSWANRKRCSARNCNTATADRQRHDDCVCNKPNVHVFPLTQWRQLHWDPELRVGCWGKRPWTILRHDSGRCLEGIRKFSEIYLEQCPGRESNSVYPAYEAPLQRRLCQRVCPVTYYSSASELLLIMTRSDFPKWMPFETQKVTVFLALEDSNLQVFNFVITIYSFSSTTISLTFLWPCIMD